MRSKSGGDGGTGAYMREGTTSRVTAADRPYGEFYGFYSVSPENFGSTHVHIWKVFPLCFYMHTSSHVYILQTVHRKLHIYVAFVQYEHSNVL